MMSEKQRIEKIIGILQKIEDRENLPEEFFLKLEGALEFATAGDEKKTA